MKYTDPTKFADAIERTLREHLVSDSVSRAIEHSTANGSTIIQFEFEQSSLISASDFCREFQTRGWATEVTGPGEVTATKQS